MASDKRAQVTLECQECKRRNYITSKHKANQRERIEDEEVLPLGPPHTVHKETR